MTTILLAVASGLIIAAPQGPPPPGPPDPLRHMERVIDRLDLTQEQEAAFRQAFETHVRDMEETRADLDGAREVLDRQVHAEVLDETAVRAAAAALASLEEDRAVARARFFQQVRGILTPDQMDRFERMAERRRQRRHDGFGSRRGPGGGPGPGSRTPGGSGLRDDG